MRGRQLARGICPLTISVCASPQKRFLHSGTATPSAPPTRSAIPSQAQVTALLTRWCAPTTAHAPPPKVPPTGVELVACVAGLQLQPPAPGTEAETTLSVLLPRLVASVRHARSGPCAAVDSWCGDVVAKKISGESLLYALQQVERALVYAYAAHAHGRPSASGVSVSEAKELALAVLAARVKLEGLLLERVAAVPYQASPSTTPETATRAAQKSVDEFSTSVPRVLNAVEHLYWCVCAPVRAGAYSVPIPPLHDAPLVTDVALPHDREQWWIRYTRTLTASTLRPVLLSGLTKRPAALPADAARQADEQAVEELKFTLRVLYGLFGSYDALSIGQRIDYGLRVMLPFLIKDRAFLLSACWGSGQSAPTVTTPSATDKSSSKTPSKPAAAAAAKPKAASAGKKKTAGTSSSSSSAAKGGATSSIVGGEQHNQTTLIVLVVLLALGYAASLWTSSQESSKTSAKTEVTEEVTKMEEGMVSSGQKGVNYQKLLSDIKAK